MYRPNVEVEEMDELMSSFDLLDQMSLTAIQFVGRIFALANTYEWEEKMVSLQTKMFNVATI